jgi:cell division protease FtsH
MSKRLGQVYFAHNKQNQFLNPNQDSGGVYSEMSAHMIDREIRQIIDEQYEKALEILRSKRDILEEAAEELLENEVIEGEALKRLADAVSKQTLARVDPSASQDRQSLAA